MNFKLSTHIIFGESSIDDFHKLFMDEVKVSKPLLTYNAAENSITLSQFKFNVDNNRLLS